MAKAHFGSKSPEKVVGAAAIISPGDGAGVVLNLSRGAATHHYRPHKQSHTDAGNGSQQLGGHHHHLGLVGAAVKATGPAGEGGLLGRGSGDGKNGSDSGSNSPDENGSSGNGKVGAGNGSSGEPGCVAGNGLESHDEGSGHGSVAEVLPA